MERIVLKDICKIYKQKNGNKNALSGFSYVFESGKAYAIIGASGAGKSTLLSMIGQNLEPTSGSVFINDVDCSELNDKKKSMLRNSYFGYIVQDFALIDDESVFYNIEIPLRYKGHISRKKRREMVLNAAKTVGIEELLYRKTQTISGGEKQRTAIARAIVCDQRVILADEPTGQLDEENRDRIMDELVSLCRNDGKMMIVVTHDREVAAKCDIVLKLSEGRLV